jgi:hypothetical protein
MTEQAAEKLAWMRDAMRGKVNGKRRFLLTRRSSFSELLDRECQEPFCLAAKL